MNYLAHQFLSFPDTTLQIGNFIADHVKGSTLTNYSSPIKKGIAHHRAIDTFTDSHPIPKIGRQRLNKTVGKYAGVALDVFYDHFLAIQWNKWNQENLLTFSDNVYSLLSTNQNSIPDSAKFMLGYMKRDNWLLNYQTIFGINRALTGLSRRTKFESNLNVATLELEKSYVDFELEFNAFFPELMDFSNSWIKENSAY